MWVIAKRELNLFFSSAIGYLTLGLFLTINTLFVWFFDTEFNVFNSGFADLNVFFTFAPWLLMLLIPAIGMRSFSDEIRSGTLELLLTKPIGLSNLVFGKFLGGLFLILFALLPTLVYFIAINELKIDNMTVDWGSTFSGYLGLLFLSSGFLSISVFSSLLSRNQVTGFLVAILINFFQFYLWSEIADLTHDTLVYDIINEIGIQEHYYSMSLGVIAIKDVIYFIGLNCFFLYSCRFLLKQIKR